ncbi:putative selenate reductase molybdopterin-binding subunit [Fistulifera solaris]|uniref:Putative selenate reductase molybdopterin-binding subunit n=1 Tax=Fistulifera solaris TaxID=1519565 RepID=A0A1Z5KJA8_FISSO|nr:putative selenate reductase molybdopterin-binding subunit [Fistulifera solaris]|eukprot:GAX26192.1 putative selenate reductase molybdopterin-binding subunit [Fistulifera solaris]
MDYLEEHLDGNLCRCTGYRPIWDAARSLCDDEVTGPCGTPCRECPERDTCQQECNVNDKCCSSSSTDKQQVYQETFLKHKDEWSQQANQMFPAELLNEESEELAQSLMVVDTTEYHAGGTWFKPTTFLELLSLLKEFAGGCKIVVGNTEVGIETKFKQAVYPRLVSPSDRITEVYGLEVVDNCLMIGSCSPLSTIQQKCHEWSQQDRLLRTTLPIHDMLRWFASTQIRNVACLGGNLVTASPISDMNPMLAASGATLVLTSLSDDDESIQRRTIWVSEFFLKYRTVDLKPNEIVERVEIPLMAPFLEYYKPFKQARRREDDISIVTASMRIKLQVQSGKYKIEDAALAFGGMAPATVMASQTAAVLIGADFCAATFDVARETLLNELKLPPNVPGGQAAFRMSLAASFLYKFYLQCVEELQTDIQKIKEDSSLLALVGDVPAAPTLEDQERSGAKTFLNEPKPQFHGVQTYPAPKVASGLEDKSLPSVDLGSESTRMAGEVGKAATHMSGPLHCTGEAVYVDDIPLPPGSLQAYLVQAKQCGVTFESLDAAPALSIPGVVAVYGYDDLIKIGGKNEYGPVVKDETVFLPPGEEIRMVGQVLAIVVAETLDSAELGARSCKIEYGAAGSKKIIVSIEDAIEAGSFYEIGRHGLERGDITVLNSLATTEDFKGEPKVGDIVKVSGVFKSGAQEHFYLETNCSLCIPSENDLTIYCSTQATNKTQMFAASATGTPANKVVVRMKRMGGGFGGKETRSVFASCAAAVAAKVSNRPVRLTLGRDVDMKTTGTRHCFITYYSASAEVTETGVKLVAFDAKLFNNAGSGLDLSSPVMDRALFHVDGCYYYPNFRIEGVPCKTVQPPHTAFRGFGGPQGMVVAEHVIDHLATACKVPGDKIRKDNFYEIGQHMHFGMIIGEQFSGKWNVPSMWDRIFREQNVVERRKEIDAFNAKHKWVKRGLAVLPTKFGIAFTAKFMNQGGALVHLYTDGTVLVSHGGTEMGQGLHTKVCQVAAQAFGIPLENVYVNDSSSDKVPNAIPTAASMSTDMYGMATLDACRQIIARIKPIQDKLGPDATLKEVALAAHMERIDLSAHGFFALDTSRCGFDWTKNKPEDFPEDAPENSWKGHPFNYFTQGVACAEVELDLLTGNHKTLRADVLVDVGSSINPAIDIGQIEGAFIQGMGWSTMEEVIYSDDDHTWCGPRGTVFTAGPGTYKIPAFNDVPEVFNVSLLENVDNPFAVHSSKAVGEPPFVLGTSVFYAIKDALTVARKSNLNDDQYFEMRMPATSERIRMYAADPLVIQALSTMLGEESTATTFQPQGSY